MKTFNEIKEFMRFVDKYEGELRLVNNKAYLGSDLIAICHKEKEEKLDKEGNIIYLFFLWFRENVILHLHKSIEEMIKIYRNGNKTD